MAAAAALADLNQALIWIGFGDQGNRDTFCEEAGFLSFEDFVGLTEKDIRDMAEEFSKHTVAQGRIPFRLRRIKLLLGVMHWVQDQDRCYRMASIDGVQDADEFQGILNVAIQRAALRKVEDNQVETISKAADPGKFKDERKWPDWEPVITNYLSKIPGSYHVPLSYVIRENEDPAHDHDFGEDFQAEMIACAPLHRAHFRADARCIHQLLKNYLVAETAEQWIKGLEVHGNGRRDMMVLREHYSGEGNASRCIATAERMRESLHYKRECSLAFSVFLDRMQRMLNIYEEVQEEFSENAKIHELFKWVQHPQLQDTVKVLKVCFDMEGLTYTQAANHLTAAISKSPEFHTTRQIAAARIRGGSDTGVHNKYNNSARKGAPKSGIRTADGKLFMGFYKHWRTLTDDETQHVIKEHKCNGNKKGTSSTKNNKHRVEELGSIQEQLHKMKRVVSELIVKQQGETHDEKKKKVASDMPQNDAGNAFGG